MDQRIQLSMPLSNIVGPAAKLGDRDSRDDSQFRSHLSGYPALRVPGTGIGEPAQQRVTQREDIALSQRGGERATVCQVSTPEA